MRKLTHQYFKDIPGKSFRRKSRQDYLIARWFGVGDKPYYRRTETRHKTIYVDAEEQTNQDLFEVYQQNTLNNEEKDEEE